MSDSKRNKMKKTAVDFIVEQLDVLHRERKENLIDPETFFKHKAVLIAEAKEMEKQQAERMYNGCIQFGTWLLLQDITSRGEGVYIDDKGNLLTVKDLLEQFKKK